MLRICKHIVMIIIIIIIYEYFTIVEIRMKFKKVMRNNVEV